MITYTVHKTDEVGARRVLRSLVGRRAAREAWRTRPSLIRAESPTAELEIVVVRTWRDAYTLVVRSES